MFDVDSWDKIPGWMNKAEGQFLYDTVLSLPTTSYIVEIGSYRGKSTNAILKACMDTGESLQKKLLTCVDNFSGPGSSLGEQRTKSEVERWRQDFLDSIHQWGFDDFFDNLYVLDSKEWFDRNDRYYHMFFIDGCHPKVAEDIREAWKKLYSGGVLLCHDYDINAPGPIKEAIDNCGVPGQHCGIGGTSIWIARKP